MKKLISISFSGLCQTALLMVNSEGVIEKTKELRCESEFLIPKNECGNIMLYAK